MRPIDLIVGCAGGTAFSIAAQHVAAGDISFGITLGVLTCVVVTIFGILLTRQKEVNDDETSPGS